MHCPVGSNRAAKTSPEWPVNSMTGDCSALARDPYSTCQRIATFSLGTCVETSSVVTYRLYEGAICARAVDYSYCRASSKVGIRLGALDQLACAKSFIGGSLLSRHGGVCVVIWVLWWSFRFRRVQIRGLVVARELSSCVDRRQEIYAPQPELSTLLRVPPDADDTTQS